MFSLNFITIYGYNSKAIIRRHLYIQLLGTTNNFQKLIDPIQSLFHFIYICLLYLS